MLEVLTEVDEKSRRNPEIIQYFTVSHLETKGAVLHLLRCEHVTHHRVSLFAERPAETHDFLRRAVSQHGLQPGPALHAEQSCVSRRHGGRDELQRAMQGNEIWFCKLKVFVFLCCSLAADFLPTFMYCMGSCNFDVVQTALRNLPEYVLLCQGKRKAALHVTQYGDQTKQPHECLTPEAACCNRLSSPPRRTCRHPAPQGLHSGHLRPDGHQLSDRRVNEGPSHGSYITTSCKILPHMEHRLFFCISKLALFFFFNPITLPQHDRGRHQTLVASCSELVANGQVISTR